MKLFSTFWHSVIICLLFCLHSNNILAQCAAPTNFQADATVGANAVTLSWSAVEGAFGYQIRVTNMVTNVTSAVIPVAAEPTAQQSFTLDGLVPDQDYLIRIRTVCCQQPASVTSECFSPYARALAALPEGHAAIVNLERLSTGNTTAQEKGPLYLCNLDLVKAVTVSIKNLSTLLIHNVTIPPDSCICWGDPATYKITIATNNFKVSTPRTRLDCSSSDNKTDAIPETFFENVLFYPNPTTGNLTIEYLAQSSENTKIVFYNNIGQQLADYSLPTGNDWQSVTYNISHLPSGVYFCKMQNKQGAKVQKIVLSNE